MIYLTIIINNTGGNKIIAFDYKKECKEFYLANKEPSIIEVPTINYIAVRGKGNPNEEGGPCHQAIIQTKWRFILQLTWKSSTHKRKSRALCLCNTTLVMKHHKCKTAGIQIY